MAVFDQVWIFIFAESIAAQISAPVEECVTGLVTEVSPLSDKMIRHKPLIDFYNFTTGFLACSPFNENNPENSGELTLNE